MQYPDCENPSIQNTSGRTQRWNSGRCALIIDESQVIHSVNKRKTVQTNMISFVSHGAGILTIMEASAEHDCCSESQRNARRTGTSYFVCTVFLTFTLRMTCERMLIHAQFMLWTAPQNLQFTLWNSRSFIFDFCRSQHGLTDFHNWDVACCTVLA